MLPLLHGGKTSATKSLLYTLGEGARFEEVLDFLNPASLSFRRTTYQLGSMSWDGS